MCILPEDENKWKNLFLSLITDEFYRSNVKFELDQVLKEKIARIFDWIVGHNIDFRENKGLFLFGSVGTGKSSILKAVMRMIDNLYSDNETGTVYTKYVTADEIARLYSENSDSSDIKLRSIRTYQLVFIDDIGYEAFKVFDHYPICEIIRDRYDNKRITCFTSNMNQAELKQRYGDSIEDKLAEMCTFIEFKGKSKRE